MSKCQTVITILVLNTIRHTSFLHHSFYRAIFTTEIWLNKKAGGADFQSAWTRAVTQLVWPRGLKDGQGPTLLKGPREDISSVSSWFDRCVECYFDCAFDGSNGGPTFPGRGAGPGEWNHSSPTFQHPHRTHNSPTFSYRRSVPVSAALGSCHQASLILLHKSKILPVCLLMYMLLSFVCLWSLGQIVVVV